MEVRAYIKNVKTSPKKLRFLIVNLRKMEPEKALDSLYYTNKKSSKIFYKALKSAINNIQKIKNIDNKTIRFKTVAIEEGQKLKRYRSGGRGGVKKYVRRYSHIRIILEGKEKILKEIKSEKVISNDKKIKK